MSRNNEVGANGGVLVRVVIGLLAIVPQMRNYLQLKTTARSHCWLLAIARKTYRLSTENDSITSHEGTRTPSRPRLGWNFGAWESQWLHPAWKLEAASHGFDAVRDSLPLSRDRSWRWDVLLSGTIQSCIGTEHRRKNRRFKYLPNPISKSPSDHSRA